MKPGQKHFVVYANVSESERELVAAKASAAGLSMSDYVRRCINAVLADECDDGPLLAEKRSRDVAA